MIGFVLILLLIIVIISLLLPETSEASSNTLRAFFKWIRKKISGVK